MEFVPRVFAVWFVGGVREERKVSGRPGAEGAVSLLVEEDLVVRLVVEVG